MILDGMSGDGRPGGGLERAEPVGGHGRAIAAALGEIAGRTR